MKGKFEWTEDFVTGNEQLDNQHKEIFKQVNELYELFSDTKKYHSQICKIIISLRTVLIKHCYDENSLLEKYDISGKEEHIKAHDEIIKSINELENYNLSSLIMALLLCDKIINYFLEHFPKYDKKFISELNQKIAMQH